jgi:hypothetical protein
MVGVAPAQQLVQPGQRLAVDAQKSVGVVLDDEELELDDEVGQLLSLAEGHGQSGGVVERRHHV